MIKKIKYTRAVLALAVIMLLPLAAKAQPIISSVTVNPPQPNFGQQFTVTVNYCAQRYNAIVLLAAVSTSNTFQNAQLSGSGQVFLVSKRGVNVAFGAATPGEDIGYPARGNWGASAPANCSFCNNGTLDAQGTTATSTFVLTMPSQENFPGCNNNSFRMLIRMRDSNMSEGDWDDAAVSCGASSDKFVSTPWTIPVMTPYYNIQKRAEGVLQDTGDLILYSISYDYGNSPLTITDVMPGGGNFTLVAAGPQGIWNGSPAVGQTAGTLTWNLPNRTGLPGNAQGTVWFLCRMTTDIPDNTVVQNTAQAGTKSSNINITIGAPVINITKSQRTQQVAYGDNVTYYLEYSINGSKLVAYQAFDDFATGTFNASTGPPPNWRFDPTTMTNGTWSILDECNTGDRVIRGASATFNYPGLLYSGLGTSFCTGTIVSDVKVGASYEGADSLIFIRNNGLSGTSGAVAYAVGLSVDRNFGGSGAQGYLGFQRCYGQPATCTWPSAPAAADPGIGKIETNRWYTVKVEALSDYSFRAKVWRRGDPEPLGWDITWTDGAPPPNSSCASGTWYTGYGQQGGDSGWVNDYYDNFIIYNPRTAASTILYDTIPVGVIYQGYAGALVPATTSPLLQWNLGNISNEGGTYTWWGRVNQCLPITNRSSISGTGSPRVATVDSNEVVTQPICPTPVITMYKTANVTQAFVGDTITFELWACNSAAGPLTADPFLIWDNVPGYISFVGFVGAPAGTGTTSLTWTFPGGLAAGACTSHVRWAGRVTGMPSIGAKEFFAVIPETRTIVAKSVCGE